MPLANCSIPSSTIAPLWIGALMQATHITGLSSNVVPESGGESQGENTTGYYSDKSRAPFLAHPLTFWPPYGGLQREREAAFS